MHFRTYFNAQFHILSEVLQLFGVIVRFSNVTFYYVIAVHNFLKFITLKK